MARFDDEIKKKLNSGEIQYNPEHWAQLEEKLNAQKSFDTFDEKAKDILESGSITGPAIGWDKIEERLNQSDSPSPFEEKAKTILENGSIPGAVMGWDKMAEKLNQSEAPSPFEEKAKDILNEGDAGTASGWAAMQSKLDAQNNYTPFEKKAKDILNGDIAAGANEAWDNMNDRLNQANPAPFDAKAKDILNSLSAEVGIDEWEDMRNKLSDQDLTAFEKAAKTVIKNGKVPYNPEHWADMERRLDDRKKRPIGWWLWGGVAASVALGTFGVMEMSSPNIPISEVPAKDKTESVIGAKENKASTKDIQHTNGESIDFNDALGKENASEKINIDKVNNVKQNLPSSIGDNDNIDIYKRNIFNPNKKNIADQIPGSEKTNELVPPVLEEENKEKEAEEKLYNIAAINIDKKFIEMEIDLGHLIKLPFDYKKPYQPQLHAGATLWLNFWNNPAVTGFYGKHQLSNCFKNNFETVESGDSKIGKVDFIQPIQNIAGYEAQLGKSGFSLGVYHHYTLKKNWNYNNINLSASYKKEILPQLFVRAGASATFHHERLAVNRLTLREQASYSDYIFTSNLGDFKARSESYISYNLGGFVDHPYFFAGYTAENFDQTFISKTEEEIMIKHRFISGVHIPVLNDLKASAMFKFEKDLVNSYSPSIGLTYKNQYFVVGEYNKLSRYDLSVGYNWRQKIRVLGTVGLKQLQNTQEELNLDYFQERKGYVSLGAFWTI